MYSLTYVSSATVELSAAQLDALLTASIDRNAAAKITGMLLYKDGHFMQVLEGSEGSVVTTFSRIQMDCRHRGLLTLLEGFVHERTFQHWSMGFKNLDDTTQKQRQAAELAQLPLTSVEFVNDPSKAQRLLLAFKDHLAFHLF